MLRAAPLLACLLALLAGCTSSPPRSARKEQPPDWESPDAMIPPVTPPPDITVPAPQLVPAPTPMMQTTWVSLDRWSRQHGFGRVRQMARTPMESYALPTSNGVFVVSVGSRESYWDGIELKLGFAPQIIDGEIFLHALDIRKNLEPALRGFAGFTHSNRVIVLDPGHGGSSNPGTQSVLDGRYEKEFTLDWALRLKSLLEQKGWLVFLTRTNDADKPLEDRVAFADRHNADLFLSLHFNSLAPNKEPSGLETYCVTPAGMPSNLTRGYVDDPAQVFPNNVFDEQNLRLALQFHRGLLVVNGNLDRGVGRARFMTVLRGQNRPAVLIEGGYLSNPREAAMIASPAHRQQLAEAIAKALQ